jgi:hypothetical protein
MDKKIIILIKTRLIKSSSRVREPYPLVHTSGVGKLGKNMYKYNISHVSYILMANE